MVVKDSSPLPFPVKAGDVTVMVGGISSRGPEDDIFESNALFETMTGVATAAGVLVVGVGAAGDDADVCGTLGVSYIPSSLEVPQPMAFDWNFGR
jgi:hypothetical protein